MKKTRLQFGKILDFQEENNIQRLLQGSMIRGFVGPKYITTNN